MVSTFWTPMVAPDERVRIATAPSTVIVFSSVRPPLMLKPPLVSEANPALLKLPPTTPALSAGTPIGFLPENDSNSMSLASTDFLTATSVWSAEASAVTVTSSVRAPASSVKSNPTVPAASSCTFERLIFLKPLSSIRSS